MTRLRGVLHTLDHLLADEGFAMSEADSAVPADLREQHTHWAKTLFNHVWTLLEREDRTPEDDVRMIHAAHASAYHWLEAGTPAHVARSHWQCSRVYSVLGRAEPALYHAELVRLTCERHGIADWDLAFAYEALARAYAVAGDLATARHWTAQAHAVPIADPDDRELLLGDLATIPA